MDSEAIRLSLKAMRPVFLQVVLVMMVAFAADQASKWIILTQIMHPPHMIEVTPFFNLRLGFNTGLSFGLFEGAFAGRQELLILITLAIIVAIAYWAFRVRVALERFGLAMIAGGALGNNIDRWLRGAVTDFLDIHWGDWHWPAFNIADIFISFGVVLFLVSSLRGEKEEARKEEAP